MANPATVDLDKSFSSALDESYGTIDVRVVVLNRKPDQGIASVEMEAEIPADAQPDEVLPDDWGKTPLAGYLEDPKRGRECVIFTVNGQRQEAWDNTFIQRELGFKYLRNRTMIVVSLDGMKPEALADIMQGSREHFYPGTVYGAIVGRLTATLKKDPDLEALEAEAEHEISQLRAGDEAVKQALDQLIDDHHQFGDHIQDGLVAPGVGQGAGVGPGPNRPQVVVMEPGSGGVPATGPYLTIEPGSEVIRLIPAESKRLKVMTSPVEAMRNAVTFTTEILPVTEGLKIATEREADSARIAVSFVEPPDIEDDFYPIEAKLRVVAWLKGHAEPRVLERKIVVSKPTERKQRQKPVLNDPPTLLKVTSRQPVRLVRGTADTHIRMRWDGKDSLAQGIPPTWHFSAKCITEPSLGPLTFSRPIDGRFELLVPVPSDLDSGRELQFEVSATGPNGAVLQTNFIGQVVEPPAAPEPRKLKMDAPGALPNRRPPYRLVYITSKEFDHPRWDDDGWTVNHAGCFYEPTEAMPLTLAINVDFAMLEEYRQQMTGKSKKLDPSTLERRVTRYTSHVAYHLYRMYLDYHEKQDAAKKDDSVRIPASEQMQGEVNRVAATLLKMMEVAG